MAIALALPFSTQAATYIVNDGGDSASATCPTNCTLRAAIRAANLTSTADTIEIADGIDVLLSAGGEGENSSVTGDLDIIEDLTIIGKDASGKNVVNAGGLDRAFHILSGASVELQNLTIQDGSVINGPGGGIFVAGSSRLQLSNVKLTNNLVQLNAATLPDSDFEEFQVSGGAIFVDTTATAIISNSEITSNQAPSGGGLTNAGRSDIRNTTISYNTSTGSVDNSGGGGGGINNQGGYLSMGNSTVTANSTAQLGGGFYSSNQGLNNGNVIITNSHIDANVAVFGGAGFANFSPATITNSTISSNEIVTDGTNRGNGAGIFNSALANLDINNSTLSGNFGAHSGGAIYNTRDVSISNTTIYNNKAEPCNPADSGCSANGQVGGNQIALYKSSSSRPTLTTVNSIIADGALSNAATTPCAGSSGYKGDIQSLGNNIENSNSCSLGHANDIVDASNLNLAALDWERNADSTLKWPGTMPVHALQANSVAIDTGSNTYCPLVDQRYLLRDDGNCDVGSYEYGATVQLGTPLVDLKATITDSPDPIIPYDVNKSQTLVYKITIVNLYVDDNAEDIGVSITLPASYAHTKTETTTTGGAVTCQDPDGSNVISCSTDSILGLGRIEIYVSGYPLQVGTIEASVEVWSSTQDARSQNNIDTETTVVSHDADDTTNYGGDSGGGGGGGMLHPLLLLLTSLLLLGRRIKL